MLTSEQLCIKADKSPPEDIVLDHSEYHIFSHSAFNLHSLVKMHVLFFLLSLLHLGGALLLPNPSGPFSVALRIQPMTDQSRLDPYAPNKDQKRQVLASIFWPVDAESCSSKRVPYMPPATAHAYGLAAEEMGLSNDTFRAFEMSVCQITAPSSCKHDESRNAKFPVAVFSSGAGNSRLLYSGMARSLASYGYVVVLLDHPYDAEIVEFPDGTIITAADISDETEDLQKATQVSRAFNVPSDTYLS